MYSRFRLLSSRNGNTGLQLQHSVCRNGGPVSSPPPDEGISTDDIAQNETPELKVQRWVIWQRDRLVALETREFGYVTLSPRKCTAPELRLNYRTFPGGWIKVALIDKNDLVYDQHKNADTWNARAIKGYSFQDCEALSGDDFNGVACWSGSGDITALRGKMVVVGLQLVRAQLFSLTI